MVAKKQVGPAAKKRRAAILAEALELFRRWGHEGGKARKNALSPEQRSELARKAVRARWAKERREAGPSRRRVRKTAG